MPRILESDALALAQNIDSLDDAQKPQALDILTRYRQQQDDFGEPEWPTHAQQQAEAETRFRSMFDAPEKVPYDPGPYAKDPNAERASYANAAFIARRYNVEFGEAVDRRRFYMDDYAAKKGQKSGLDDMAFYNLAKGEVAETKLAEDTRLEGAKAALRGEDGVRALSEWQIKNPDKNYAQFTQGFLKAQETAGDYLGIADELFSAMEVQAGMSKDGKAPTLRGSRADAKFAEYDKATGFFSQGNDKGTMSDVMARNVMSDIVDEMADMKPREQKAVFQIINAKIEAAGYDQKGFWAQAMSGLDRGFGRLPSTITGASETVLGKIGSVLAVGEEPPAEFAAGLEEADRKRAARGEVIDRISDVISGKLDPVTATVGFLPDSLEKGMIRAPGAVLPFMAISATTGFWTGFGLMSLDFAEQTRRDLRAGGMDNAQAENIGLVAAPFLAGVEQLSNWTQLGRFPGVQAALANFAKPITGKGVQGAVRYGQNFLASLGVEMSEETLQNNLIVPAIQNIAAKFDEAIPGVGLGEIWDNIKRDTPDTFWTILPAALVFGGSMTMQQAELSDAATADRDLLMELGFSASQANETASKPTVEERVQTARSLWGVRAGTPITMEAAAKNLSERMRQLQGDAVAQQQELERRGKLPVMRPIGDRGQWTVFMRDGSNATFDTIQEAQKARWDWVADQLGEQHKTTRETLNSMERNLPTGRELAVEISPDARFATPEEMSNKDFQDRIAQGKVLDGLQDAVAIDAAMSGDSADAVKILGTSNNEMLDGVLRTTIRLYEGANILTLVEEKLEGDIKVILSDAEKRGKMIDRLREYEALSGDSIFTDGITDENLTTKMIAEAWSHLGQSYLVGRSTFGEPLQAKTMRRFGKFLMGAKLMGAMNAEAAFFEVVVGRAKKLGELQKAGKLGADLTAELEKQLGIDSQVAHDAGAEVEARQLIDTSGYSEETPGPNGETFSTSRATPADSSNVVQMPDGARLVGPTTFSLTVYHGTPHKVDKFTTAKIGTGEGAQAYGWGLYMASSREVAESYRKNLSGDSATQSRLRAGMPTASDKGLSDSVSAYLENLSKTLVTESLVSKRFSQLDIPARSVFVSEMIRVFDDSQILDAVIRLVPVDVVNMLSGKQYSAEYLRSNPTMLIYLLSAYADNPVSSGVEAINVLSGALTIAGAKAKAGFAGLETLSSEDVSALRAGKFDHVDKIPQPLEFVKGNLYTVELLPDEDQFLDWDKPLSEQSEKVKEVLPRIGILARGKAYGWKDNLPMGEAYRQIAADFESEQKASEELAKAGIPGIRYLDGGSRGAGEGTYNYVIFDENLVRILEENGKPVGETFSLRSGDFASRAAAMFSPFQRTPELRMAIARVAKERAMRLGAEWIEKAAVIRSASSINREVAFREADGFDRRMTAYLDSLTPNARQNLEFEPASLEDDPLISAMLDFGKLMSRSTAIKNGVQNMDEFEGAPWLPPAWYSKGSGITPGKMAKAMHEGADGNGGPLAAGDSAADLWDAVASRIESSRKDKAAYREAVQAFRDAKKTARAEAKAEAEAWGERTKKTAGSPKAQRDMLKAALRTLDGILSAAPPEVRARVGGYVKLAGLATDEAMLQEIERRVAKMNVELEKWLKREAVREITKILKKGRPDSDPGKKAMGKNADMHALFAAASAAVEMDALTVAGRLADLDTRIASDELTPEQEILAITERGLVELVGNLKDADSGRAWSALETLRDIYQEGWVKWKLKQIEKRENRAGLRHDLITDTGKKGIKTERDAADKRAMTLLGKIKGGFLSLSSFHEVLSYAFGSSERVTSLVDAERTASGQYEDATQALADEVEALFSGMAGGTLAGERLRFDLAQRTIKTAKGEFSQLEAIQALLMWRQEDGQRHMEGARNEAGEITSSWSYDQAWVNEIEASLTPEARRVMAWIGGKYGSEWQTLNPLYRERYGVNLPHHDNYAPLTVAPMQAKAGEVVDPVSGAAISSGSVLTPGSLRTRSRSAIAEPKFRDALQTLVAHTRQMEYWKAYFDLATEASAILGNREVQNAVRAKGGEEAASALQKWVDAIAQGGFRDASASLGLSKMLAGMTGRAASVGLLGRFSTLLVQSTQLAAASVKMPVGAYLRGVSKLLTGNLGYGEAIKSEFIQRRYKSAPPIVRQAMESLGAASRPNQITRATRSLGQLLSGADALFTAGTYALLLDYHRTTGAALGLSGAELETHAHTEAERATEQVAQPTRMATRSLAELTSTNPIAKVSWAYASEARQKIALMAWAASKATAEPAQFAKTAFLVFGVGGLMTQILKNLWREAKGDDDESKWSPERLTLAALTGPLHGVPLASELMGDKGMLSGVAWAWPALKDVASGGGDMRDVDTLLSVLGLFNDTAAGIAVLSHAGLDAAKVLENATTSD